MLRFQKKKSGENANLKTKKYKDQTNNCEQNELNQNFGCKHGSTSRYPPFKFIKKFVVNYLLMLKNARLLENGFML